MSIASPAFPVTLELKHSVYREASERRYPEGMSQATKSAKTAAERRAAAERTRGMFAHVVPGVSLANDLIAERRAEAQADKQAGTQR